MLSVMLIVKFVNFDVCSWSYHWGIWCYHFMLLIIYVLIKQILYASPCYLLYL